MIGSYSPIHCRLVLTLIGILSVLLSIGAGFGFCFAAGWKVTEANEAIPIIMLGIGVDDIFVICNAIDQTPLSLPASKRLRLAMRHAGPTITITSLTNAFAFLAAISSTILAIQSFSFMAFACVIFLYLAVMTIFVPAACWDTVKVEKR